MAKCVITIEDEGDEVSIKTAFDPPLPKAGTPEFTRMTDAQKGGLSLVNGFLSLEGAELVDRRARPTH